MVSRVPPIFISSENDGQPSDAINDQKQLPPRGLVSTQEGGGCGPDRRPGAWLLGWEPRDVLQGSVGKLKAHHGTSVVMGRERRRYRGSTTASCFLYGGRLQCFKTWSLRSVLSFSEVSFNVLSTEFYLYSIWTNVVNCLESRWE
jgi:hypothetical protein